MRTLVFVVLLLIDGVAAQAAMLANVKGDVRVNAGQGFKAAASGQTINPGDRVMLGPGGSAAIVYDQQCLERVEPGLVAVVKSFTPCNVTGGTSPTAVPPAVGVAGVAAAVGGSLLIYQANRQASP